MTFLQLDSRLSQVVVDVATCLSVDSDQIMKTVFGFFTTFMTLYLRARTHARIVILD